MARALGNPDSTWVARGDLGALFDEIIEESPGLVNQEALEDHEADSTEVHGIPDTADLVDSLELASKADAEDLTIEEEAREEVGTKLDNLALANVKDFGATGDGATDDTAAVEQAIAAVDEAGGGILLFPAGGTYRVSTVAPVSNLTVMAYGATIEHIAGTETPIFYQVQAEAEELSNIRFEGGTLIGQGQEEEEQIRKGIKLAWCRDVVVRDLVVEDFPHAAIDIRDVTRCWILDNRVRNCCTLSGGNAINVQQSGIAEPSHHNSDIFVLGNFVDGCPTSCINVTNGNEHVSTDNRLRAIVANNNCQSSDFAAITLEISGNSSRELIVTGNKVRQTGGSGAIGIQIADNGGGGANEADDAIQEVLITQNLITNETGYGIECQASSTTITGNVIVAARPLRISTAVEARTLEDVVVTGNVLKAAKTVFVAPITISRFKNIIFSGNALTIEAGSENATPAVEVSDGSFFSWFGGAIRNAAGHGVHFEDVENWLLDGALIVNPSQVEAGSQSAICNQAGAGGTYSVVRNCTLVDDNEVHRMRYGIFNNGGSNAVLYAYNNLVLGTTNAVVTGGAAFQRGNISEELSGFVEAASEITMPQDHEVIKVTGNAEIKKIAASWDGRRVVLRFTGTPKVVSGENLALAGNFEATSSDIIELVYASGSGKWHEISRSVN